MWLVVDPEECLVAVMEALFSQRSTVEVSLQHASMFWEYRVLFKLYYESRKAKSVPPIWQKYECAFELWQ